MRNNLSGTMYEKNLIICQHFLIKVFIHGTYDCKKKPWSYSSSLFLVLYFVLYLQNKLFNILSELDMIDI